MSNRRLPRPLAGVLVATALVAAACGSDTSTVGLDASAVDQTAQAESSTTQAESDATTASEPDADATADSDATAEAEGPQPDEEAAPADVGDHLFPDLNTVNIADGQTLNLATELAGGDTPVLLWFFAPH